MRFHTILFGSYKQTSPKRPQVEPIPFQMRLPLALKKTVSSKSEKTREASCLQEMAVMFACFKNNEFDQIKCSQEISSFQTCFENYKQRSAELKAQEKKGILVPGEKKLTHRQMNLLLKRYPPLP
ncbi:Coiled-coil-helix-coiled-coil-helix domain-containing protein 1 [Eumeta japonica]|uniref:Coiled-coil-helix-coiled-coil-helix domain-containing protein 1 n=1 Tax=Eumeta variegata TaxID=151549 RepID=A0A4C1TUB0_EUMVA|nr:Coiled-coil-helix-coiled-coil-helix domain-containing protein 1 [Eumeta japonica]